VTPVQRATAGLAVVVDASVMVDVLSGQPHHERLVAMMLDAPMALDAPLLTTDRWLARAVTDRGLAEVVDVDAG
jgi:predicted nucleic acid-binding protein